MEEIEKEFLSKLHSALNAVMPTIVIELMEIKKSYFSETGKPGWKPLAESTVKRKSSGKPVNKSGWIIPQDNANKFNTAFGFLKNSIKVDYQIFNDELSLTVEAHHRDGDQAIATLIDTYGRDFLRFDEKEIKFIKKRLGELLADRFG